MAVLRLASSKLRDRSIYDRPVFWTIFIRRDAIHASSSTLRYKLSYFEACTI